MLREGAVRAFDGNACAGPQPGSSQALVTETLDRDPEIRRSRQSGERVRMSVPPEIPREKAPLEELTTRDGEAIELPTRADQREDSRCLLADTDDAELMTQTPRHRIEKAEDDHQS